MSMTTLVAPEHRLVPGMQKGGMGGPESGEPLRSQNSGVLCQESQLATNRDCFGAVLCAAMTEDMIGVTLDPANTDRKPISNLPARGTAGYQLPDFVLALAERFDQRLPVPAHILRLAARAQLAAPKIMSDRVGGQRRRQPRHGSTGDTEALQVAAGRRPPYGSFKRRSRCSLRPC
jgi:hypothetical protein